MTEAQKQSLLERDWNGMLQLGGNIYFTAKLAATDGLSFQQIAATMSGSTQDEYAQMMISGDARSKAIAASRNGRTVARIVAGVATSHIPPSARPGTTARRTSPIGGRCSRASSAPRNGSPGEARCMHRCLQRPHVGVFARDRSHLRGGLRGGIPDRGRRLGAAQGSAGERPAPSLPRISCNRSSSTNSISPSSTRWRSITA